MPMAKARFGNVTLVLFHELKVADGYLPLHE